MNLLGMRKGENGREKNKISSKIPARCCLKQIEKIEMVKGRAVETIV